jgi:lysophospholipase L1-like esterase
MNHFRSIVIILILSGFSYCFAQESQYPYYQDIQKFRQNDSVNPPPLHVILFAGSSTFTLWKDVQDYFPGHTIINRGFGGSTLADQIHYVESVVFPYSPHQIVIYCGENDLASNDSITFLEVCDRFVKWFSIVRAKFPGVRITYVSMKPSPSRWYLAEKFIHGNRCIRGFIKSQKNADYVDVWSKMLDKSDRPDSTLFLDDRLHMNEKGYRIWQKAIKPKLTK